MKRLFKTAVLLVTICCSFMACGGNDDDEPGNNGTGNNGTPEPEPTSLNITPIGNLNQGSPTVNSHADATSRSSLKMNFRNYVELGQSSLGVTKPHYARIKKMANGNYIMFYHNNQIGADCYYAIGQNLNSWSSKGQIFSSYKITDSKGSTNERRFSNTDALVLSNGDILAVASFRANEGYRDLPKDAGIVMKRSTDNGARWSGAEEIYQGVNWEPYLLQLPSGEIHCYFTDSNRTGIESNDTGTAMVVSKDNGKTWIPSLGNIPYYVIRTKHQKGFTNQMPAVIKLNGSNQLTAALEAKDQNDNYNYYISFAYSDENGEWKHLNADEEGPANRNDFAFKGSAPYIVQFPSGETVLSYNQSSTYYMKLGDATAHNFSSTPYAPFPGKGFWGTLERIDNHQLIGVMPNTGDGKVMLAEFILNHRITATRRKVNVDGSNSEWVNTDHVLFVGDKSQAQATLRCTFDDDNVYFLVEVLDKFLMKDDYADIYISPVTDNTLTGEACRIRVSHDGLRSSSIYNNGWKSTDLNVSAKATFEGTILNNHDEDTGYVAEVAIPRSKLNIKSGEILVNFSIFDAQGGLDAISDISLTNTAKWIPITGLQ